MIKFFNKKSNKLKIKIKGFAMLFAVLLASFLVTLGVSIFSISLKEIQIATSIRDSQIAYYAADSARECVLYWDVKEGVFPVVNINEEMIDNGKGSVSVTCNGHTVDLLFNKKNDDTYLSETKDPFFEFDINSSSTPVAKVQIEKVWNSISEKIITTITSFGYNTSIKGRRVERGIKTINN